MSTPDSNRSTSNLDQVPPPILVAFFILAASSVTTLGLVLFGYVPIASITLALILLACAFSMLTGSPISLALTAMTGFFVIVSSMIAAQEIPQMRTGALIATVIFVVVMGLALSQFRWFFRPPSQSGARRQ